MVSPVSDPRTTGGVALPKRRRSHDATAIEKRVEASSGAVYGQGEGGARAGSRAANRTTSEASSAGDDQAAIRRCDDRRGRGEAAGGWGVAVRGTGRASV